jgi:hypothetical protein
MPIFKKKGNFSGGWVPGDPNARSVDPTRPESWDAPQSTVPSPSKGRKGKKMFRVVTVRGRQEQGWVDSGLWQPLQETVIPAEAKAQLTVVHFGTYGSDGMRRDGAPAGAYSSVFDQYAMQGQDLYTKDEARRLKQWDTRKPFPGFDPKLGSKTLDIYSED